MATLRIPPSSFASGARVALGAPGARVVLGACLALAIGCASTSPSTPAVSAPTAPGPSTPPAARATPSAPATGGDARFDAELTAYPYPFPVQFRELTSQR